MTGGEISRRERSKSAKMQRILAAAEELFSKNGFEGTTVQQIADKADVAVGTLFLYASDKSEILLRIFLNRIHIELTKATKRLKAQKAFLPSIKRFFMDLMIPYQMDRDLSKAFWREFLFHSGKVRIELDQQAKDVLQALEEKIVTAQTRGQVDRHVDAPVGALHLYAIFHATLAFYLADCLPATSPAKTVEALLYSMWRGMEPATERDRR